jgi:hypothetical protein
MDGPRRRLAVPPVAFRLDAPAPTRRRAA